MTVIVTRMPGGVAQVYNPQTGKITYKSRSGEAYMMLDAFDGIVKFHKKGSKAIVAGKYTSLEDASVISKGSEEYAEAERRVLESTREFKREELAALEREIAEISGRL